MQPFFLKTCIYSTMKIAKELSEKFKDRPLSPMDTAIYWIEHVAKFKGGQHMRSPAVNLPWYQYYLIDVLGLISALVALSLYLIYKLPQVVFAVITQTLKKKKLKVS